MSRGEERSFGPGFRGANFCLLPKVVFVCQRHQESGAGWCGSCASCDCLPFLMAFICFDITSLQE